MNEEIPNLPQMNGDERRYKHKELTICVHLRKSAANFDFECGLS